MPRRNRYLSDYIPKKKDKMGTETSILKVIFESGMMTRRQIGKELAKDPNTNRTYSTIFDRVKHLTKGKEPSLEMILTKNGRSGFSEESFDLTNSGIRRVISELHSKITILDIINVAIRYELDDKEDYKYIRIYQKKPVIYKGKKSIRTFDGTEGKKNQYLISEVARNYKNSFPEWLHLYKKKQLEDILTNILPHFFVENLRKFKRLSFDEEPYVKFIIDIIGYHNVDEYGQIAIKKILSKLKKNSSGGGNVFDKNKLEEIINDLETRKIVQSINLKDKESSKRQKLEKRAYVLDQSGFLLLLHYLYKEIESKMALPLYFLLNVDDKDITRFLPNFENKMSCIMTMGKVLFPRIFESRYRDLFNFTKLELLYIFNLLYFEDSVNEPIPPSVLRDYVTYLGIQEKKQLDKYLTINEYLISECKLVHKFIIEFIEFRLSGSPAKDKFYLRLKELEKIGNFEIRYEEYIIKFLVEVSYAILGIEWRPRDWDLPRPSLKIINVLKKIDNFLLITFHFLDLFELARTSTLNHRLYEWYQGSSFNTNIDDRITLDFYFLFRNLKREKWKKASTKVKELVKWHDEQWFDLIKIGRQNIQSYEKLLPIEEQKTQ